MIVDSACKIVKDSSRDIWNLILRGKKQGVNIQEETITEILLLNLAEKFGSRMKITLFNKREEGKNGADWEWYIKKNGKWIGFNVQAKILNHKNEMYDSLFYKNKKSGEYQIDKLIINAFKKGLIPIYSFYNYVEKPSKATWYKKYFTYPKDFELMGWTFATAIDAYKFKRKGSAGFIDFELGKNSEYMSKPFCQLNFFKKVIAKTKKDVRKVLEGKIDEVTEITKLFEDNDIKKVPSFDFKKLEDLPYYVGKLYKGEDDDNIIEDRESSNNEDDPLYIVIIDLDMYPSAEDSVS